MPGPAAASALGSPLSVSDLVDDPELRFTDTGIAVASLRVAVTQRIQQDGQWRDGDTSFLEVSVWRGQLSTWPTSWPRAAELLTLVDQTMQPASASVWLRPSPDTAGHPLHRSAAGPTARGPSRWAL